MPTQNERERNVCSILEWELYTRQGASASEGRRCLFEVVFQLPAEARVSNFPQGFRFDLADTLARYS